VVEEAFFLVVGAAWAWVELLILVWCVACGFDGAARPAGRENPDGSLVWHRDFGILPQRGRENS
jgi:hypothetical protein